MQSSPQIPGISYPNTEDEQAKLGRGGNDPFDKEYPRQYMKGEIDLSPYPRTNKILRRIHALPDMIDSRRAVLITEAFQKYENDAPLIKAANVLSYLLHNLPVDVYDDELIVGDMGCPPRCAPIYPEFSLEWICDEMINFPFEKRDQDRFAISEQAKQDLLGIRDYWKGRTVEDAIANILSAEEKKGSVLPGARPVFHPNLHLYGGIGHFIADYETLFAIGFIGIRRKIEAKMEKLMLTDPRDIEKREFYNAIFITLDAVKNFFCRYGAVARQKAGQESNPVRRQELLKIAENVEWVAENPPRTFWEAMQLYHLATNVIVIDSNGHSIGYGRLEGYDAFYELVNSEKVHHYGNDDDYADDIAHFVVNSFIDEFGKYQNARGGKILAGCLCGGGNLGLGSCLAATPDGRRAYEPVSNSINPVYGSHCCHDYNGPTAVLKSVGKLDSPRMGNGTLLNLKFSPNVVSGEVGRDNLIRFLETLVKLRVQHIQLTLQDKQTLLDAKAHPENYSSLLVCVAAYSAYFTRLSPLLQEEVINRHEHSEFE